MQFKKLLLFVLLAAVFGSNANATEIIGGSLRYEALGNQQYKVIGVVNRNCGDSSLPIPTFKVYSGSTTFNLIPSRTSIKDITPHCKNSTPPCNPSNTKTTDGQEQHTFEASIDFSKSPYNVFYTAGQCQVFFSMEACCRSSKTMNITANNFYLEAMLNLCVLGTSIKNSNSDSNTATYALVCANTPYIYNRMMYEKDADSVIHSIEKPKKNKDSFERFIGQFSTKYPMTPFCLPYGTINCAALPNAKPPRGFHFDSSTGDFILTPTVVNEEAIINIRTSEFRRINSQVALIGYSTTEVYVNVKACPDNNTPTIPTANKWGVCEGDKLCFTIQSQDQKSMNQTIDDTTTLTWEMAIPRATFRIIDPTAREKSAEFCWQTKTGDARPNAYSFTVYAKDDNCPRPATSAKGFTITVRPKAQAVRKYNFPACDKISFNSFPKDTVNFTGSYNYEWTIRDSTNSGTPFYKTFKKLDSFKHKRGAKVVVTHVINNPPLNCPSVYTDTVVIDCAPNTALQPANATRKISVYPNPASGLVSFLFPENLHWTEMKLINSLGQEVYNGPVSPTFDMGPFAIGVYILELTSNEGKYHVSVIRE